MKIALVAPSGVPFVVGGAEKLWWGLSQYVNRHTPHELELVKIPSPERTFWEIAQSYENFSKLDLSHFDAVISTKYPAWMVHHPNHVVYLQHRLRGLYDTWPTRLAVTPSTLPDLARPLWRLLQSPGHSRDLLPEIFGRVRELKAQADAGAAWVGELTALPGALVRALVHKLDDIALAPGQIGAYMAISGVVAQREEYFPKGSAVEVVPHPSNLEGLHVGQAEFVFTASRLEAPKRLDLLIRAYRHCKTQIPLKVAGDGPDAKRLFELATGDDRIEFLGRLTDDELVDHYSRAALVPFVPTQEDMGLVTLEAMGCGKPVLTVSDAGGVTEFVKDGVNGRVVAPEAKTLSRALDEMLADPGKLRAMGEAALQTSAEVNWANTTERLLAAATRGLERRQTMVLQGAGLVKPDLGRRKRLLVLNTFGVYPPNSGGKKRAFYLYGALAQDWDVTLLNLDATDGGVEIRNFDEHYREVRVPPSDEFGRQEAWLTKLLSRSVTDIAAMLYSAELREFETVFKELALEADLVMAAHVYFGPLVQRLWSGPLWYDAHNVEADIKADILGVPRLQGFDPEKDQDLHATMLRDVSQADAAKLAVRLVASAEYRLVHAAERVLAVSEADRERLVALYGCVPTTVEVLPNGTKIPEDAWLEPARRGTLKETLGLGKHPLAVFVGAHHGPNLDAVDTVVELASQCPEWIFAVAGSVCRHLEGCRLPSNLYALGVLTEAELKAILRAADVGLNPMLKGSGTNLKMLDYAAHGALVLTSTVGVRGLDFVAGQHCVACEVPEFAQALSKLARETPGPMPAMRAEAWALTNAVYNWRTVGRKVLAP